jgi:hypothetical protein
MRAITKVFVVGTLGLAVLVGSSAVSLALPKDNRTRDCSCTCNANGHNSLLTFSLDGYDCELGNGQRCTGMNPDGTLSSGKLYNCCDRIFTSCRGAAERSVILPPEVAPPAPVSPGEQRHQVAPKLNQ